MLHPKTFWGDHFAIASLSLWRFNVSDSIINKMRTIHLNIFTLFTPASASTTASATTTTTKITIIDHRHSSPIPSFRLHAKCLVVNWTRKFILTPHTSSAQVWDSTKCPRLSLAPSFVSSLVLLLQQWASISEDWSEFSFEHNSLHDSTPHLVWWKLAQRCVCDI